MTTDGNVIPAQSVRLGELGHIPQQGAEGFQAVIIGITIGTETGQQVIDQIADGIGD
ncbi:hypothetical protein D3C87_1894590 [compost metagenome]